jgi:hypothetical protein
MRYLMFLAALCSAAVLPLSAQSQAPLTASAVQADESPSALPPRRLISYEKVNTYPRELLDSVWKANKVPKSISPVRYSVEVYEVLYWTIWHDGSPLRASGLYFLPEGQRDDLPLVSFNHGSQSERRGKVKLGSEAIITTALATDGYAALMPDYVGLGKGDRFHLYHHAETEAYANIDMLRAVRELNSELGVSTNDMLFISGYSQGGHAAMATHKFIEERYLSEFNLTASAPMSGAYDLAGVQAGAMFRSYDTPGYFPFLLWGMNEAYGAVPDLRLALKPEYADTLVYMLESQQYSLNQISRAMPSVPAEIVQPELLQAYASDTAFALRRAMQENSLLNWAPTRPMMLCYCEADEQVDYRNSVVTYERMVELGSESVRLRRAGKKFGHESCALYSAIYTKLYFDSFRKGSEKGRKGPLGKRMMIGMGRMTASKP